MVTVPCGAAFLFDNVVDTPYPGEEGFTVVRVEVIDLKRGSPSGGSCSFLRHMARKGGDAYGGNDCLAIAGLASHRNDRAGDTSRRSCRNIMKKVTRRAGI